MIRERKRRKEHRYEDVCLAADAVAEAVAVVVALLQPLAGAVLLLVHKWEESKQKSD